MKIVILNIILLCSFSLSVYAQGITFREGSWKEILAMAKKENKLVFVDNYTSWCGPCKKMAKEIFPLKEAGDFYNANFICYKLDCEKGDGIEVAKTYQIHSFPTYLFVDGNGKLFYRSGGYMSLEKFLQEGQTALDEFADKRTIEEWDALYARKKNNASFLKAYIAKRNRAKLDNADILDQYVSVEKEKNLLNKAFIDELLQYDAHINAGGPCANFIASHWDTIAALSGRDNETMAQLFSMSIVNYSYNKAVKEKSQERLNSCLTATRWLASLLGLNSEDESVKTQSRFYAAIGDVTTFESLAEKHADILFKEEQGVLERDQAAYLHFLENMIKTPSDIAGSTPEQLAFTLQFAAGNEATSLSFSFRDLAANVAKLSGDKDLLNKAMLWAMEAIVLFDNFTNYETLAEVLFKMGYKKEALFQMEKAVNKMPAGNEAISKRIHDKLNHIKNNQ